MATATETTLPVEPLITEEQIAAVLGVSRRTVRAWVAAGRFPKPLKHGGWIRWRAADLHKHLAQLDQQRQQPQPAA
jgi:excisionase family DNA binding protein